MRQARSLLYYKDMKALFIFLTLFLIANFSHANCTKEGALDLASSEKVETKLKLSLENMDLAEQKWCLVNKVLEKKIQSENDATGFDDKHVLAGIKDTNLEDLTTESKTFIDYLINQAKGQNDIDETKWILSLLNRAVIIENQQELELLELIFVNANHNQQINSHKIFDIAANLNGLDNHKVDFMKTIIYTSIRKGVIDRNQLLDQLARRAIKGQDFLDSIGEDKVKLLTVLLLGEKSKEQLLSESLYKKVAQSILLNEDAYLCLGSQLVKYLNAGKKTRFVAASDKQGLLEMTEDGLCPIKNVLSQSELNHYIEKQLNLAKQDYTSRLKLKLIISARD